MGHYATKYLSDKADAHKCTPECQKFVADVLAQSQFETLEAAIKDLFEISFGDLGSFLKKGKNEAKESIFSQLTDFPSFYEGSGSHNSCIEINKIISKPDETSKVSGIIKTCISNDEASILAGSWAPNITNNADLLCANVQLNSDKTVNSRIKYALPIHGYNFEPTVNCAFYHEEKRPVHLGFYVSEQGLSCGVNFRLYPNVQQSLRYEAGIRHQIGIGPMSMVALANCGHKLKSSLKHTAVFDDRDSEIFPTRGNQVEFTSELSGLGGNVCFLKNNLQVQHIFPLPRCLILETTFGCGLLNPFNCETYYMDAFRLGGPSSVRGFQTNGIDPHNNCVTSYWLGNVHLYLPFITRPQSNSVNVNNYYTQLFINSGGLGGGNDCLQKDLTDLRNMMRVSCGVGLVICVKALGKMEVNYCVPVRQQRDDNTVAGFQFGISFNLL